MSWFSTITEWAQKLDAKWLSAQTLGRTFQEFAYQEMQGHAFHESFNLNDAVKEILELPKYPNQVSPLSAFGDPPITLYISENKHFYLDLYIWTTSQTSIHQHAFEGAFTVLQGRSMESVYTFLKSETMGEAFWGELKAQELFLLRPGDVRPIIFKDGTIHRVLHLSKPTVSMVLRTGKGDTTIPQFNYNFGCLATHGFPPGDVKGKLRLIEWYLNQGQLPSFPMIQPLLEHSELWYLLQKYEHANSLIRKISFFLHHEQLVAGMQRQSQFQFLFLLLDSETDKMLLTAYEHFDGENWTRWVDKNLNIAPEAAKKQLRQALEGTQGFTEASKSLILIKNLFV